MGIFDDWKLRILCAGFLSKGTYAWVESYDGGEDDEKVIKIMLPLIAIAVLACVMGYYIKNKFFKNDEKDDEKDTQEKNIAGMNFPAPKANKPWLNMASQGQKGPMGPPGGYEYTLPGYQQATSGNSTDKRTASQQSGGSKASSGYASHVTGVHQVTEKRGHRGQQRGDKENREAKRTSPKSASKAHKSDPTKKSRKPREDGPQAKPTSRPPPTGTRQHGQRRERNPNPNTNPQSFNPASRPSRGNPNRH